MYIFILFKCQTPSYKGHSIKIFYVYHVILSLSVDFCHLRDTEYIAWLGYHAIKDYSTKEFFELETNS